MPIKKNNKDYGTRVRIEEIQPNPYSEYLTGTYTVTAPSDSFKILNGTSGISGWRYKGATTWETPVTTISVTTYGLIEIEFNLTNNTSIPNSVFRDCNRLVKIQFPSTITTIGSSSFFNTGLIELPNLKNVTSIGSDCFYNCVFNYVDYTINDNVNRSGWNLKSMNFSDTSLIFNKLYVNGTVFRAIKRWTQGDNVDLTNGIDGLPIYKWYAYGGSYQWKLNSIKFPATLTNITGRAFQSCTITDLYFYGTTPPVCDIYDSQGIWYNSNITNIYVPAEALTTYQNSSDFADVASKIQAMS